MGRLLSVHPCPVCNYHVEDELHEGGSGSDPVFLRNHYWLATCHDCREIVSVLVANTDEETQAALKSARSQIVQMEADAVIGDYRAKDLLPFFREALDQFDGSEPPAETVCSICGGHNFTLIADLDEALFDSQEGVDTVSALRRRTTFGGNGGRLGLMQRKIISEELTSVY